MVWDTFFGLIALLYYLAFLLLIGLAAFIAHQSRNRSRTRARQRRAFFLLALSLLLWQLTLFLEVRTALPAAQLWLGRANFTAIVLASYLALEFVREVATPGTPSRSVFWLRLETGLLAVLTLLTPLVSAAERVEAEQALTTFGPLFPLYLLHVLGCWGAALVLAWRESRRRGKKRAQRWQLRLIGVGMLLTGGVALITNALLPYGFGDFRFCDLGTLSTLLFVLAVAYATLLHGLFNVRTLLRETLVYGLLLAFVLGSYSSSVFLVMQYLTSRTGRPTQFAVLLIAFSVDPLRRFLEKKVDHLLFREPKADKVASKRWRHRPLEVPGKGDAAAGK